MGACLQRWQRSQDRTLSVMAVCRPLTKILGFILAQVSSVSLFWKSESNNSLGIAIRVWVDKPVCALDLLLDKYFGDLI